MADGGHFDAVLALGPSHLERGGRLHRVPNLLRERWWYDRGLPTYARRFGADVLLMPSNLSARTTIPQVVTILDVNFLTQPGTYERTFVQYATWAYRRSVRDAARITTISAFSRREIAHHLDVDPARIDVVYPGLDPVACEPVGPSPHPNRYALYVGATERHKNLQLLFDAWRGRSPRDLDLVLVGQPGRDHPRAVAAAAASRGRIVVRGAVSADELEGWYRHATVFLFPSLVEGFGYPPLEAMQRGVPVASSTAGSLPEVVGDGSLLFDPDDVTGLVRCVERVVDDDELRQQLLATGRSVAARYTWAATSQTMARILVDSAARRVHVTPTDAAMQR
jgi:glycosyltransferase involved in cell wall biosynthesis